MNQICGKIKLGKEVLATLEGHWVRPSSGGKHSDDDDVDDDDNDVVKGNAFLTATIIKSISGGPPLEVNQRIYAKII